MDYIKELSIGITGFIIGWLTKLYLQNREFKQKLDSATDFRKRLFFISSKDKIGWDEFYGFRASLKIFKNDTPNEYSFNSLTDYMIEFCDDLENKKNQFYKFYLSNKEKEQIRIFCRYLLKRNFEYLTLEYSFWSKVKWSLKYQKLFSKNAYNQEPDSLVKKTFEELEKNCKKNLEFLKNDE